MKYRDILGFTEPKKKIIKEQPKSKRTVLDKVKQELKLNEWHHQPPTEKRWSKTFGGNGLTEFEKQGGKDTIKEVGASTEFKKYQKRIENDLDSLIDSTAEMKILLKRMGGDKEAKEFGSIMVTGISKIHNYMKTKFVRMVRKLI